LAKILKNDHIVSSFSLPLQFKWESMVTELIIVWVIGVVAFFVLWAILAKIIKHISDKKNKSKNTEI